MSVLINGMKMPTGCCGCPIDSDSCKRWVKVPVGKLREERPKDCPLVPVPKHGDLIDKSGVEVLPWTEDPEKDFADGVLFVLDKLDELPVIIPAEGDDYEVPTKEGDG